VQESLRRPCRIALVGAGPVRRDRTVTPLQRRAPMAGHAFSFVDECHDLRTHTHSERLLDQRLGPRGVVPCDFHRVINIAPSVFPLGICIGRRGQRPEREAVEGFDQLLA
jgi:hypothetical protein